MPVTVSSSGKSRKFPKNTEALAEVLSSYPVQNSNFSLSKSIPLVLLREASIIQVKGKIAENLTPDINLIQAIEALDENYGVTNILSERLLTWQSQTNGSARQDIDELLGNNALPEHLVTLKEHYEFSVKSAKFLSEYIEQNAPIIIPLTVNIVGNQLAVRLVAAAGSLSKLARMPSSTIQLLGAEKALFRHMSDGSPPPKYGYLYQHPLVRKASKKDKGKISRKLASKVSIASKIDYYGEKNE
tara:strand:+ start:870 stop:1601 length:732 start_codon:yes stop_codon:yes gene_type:complete